MKMHRSNPPSGDEDVARLRLKLSHLSLPDLVKRGLVEWDRDDHVVTKGPAFDKELLEERGKYG